MPALSHNDHFQTVEGIRVKWMPELQQLAGPLRDRLTEMWDALRLQPELRDDHSKRLIALLLRCKLDEYPSVFDHAIKAALLDNDRYRHLQSGRILTEQIEQLAQLMEDALRNPD